MAFGINTEASTGGDGQFAAIMLYMAREGRFYIRDRISGTAGYENADTELKPGSKMIFDFGTVEVGWLRFAPGMAPSFVTVPVGQPIPPAPDSDHRQGIKCQVWTGKKHGLREFANTAKTVLSALDALHTQFEQAPEARAGKLPIVTFDGADAIVTENRHGTQRNFRPRFTIIGWTDRLSELGAATVPPPGAARGAPQPPRKAAGAMAPPPPPPPMVNPDDDWGLPPGQPAATPADPWGTSTTARPNGGSARGPSRTMADLDEPPPF